MKAISIQQPWAYLVVCGYKLYETRSWPTDYRGELLIHASKRYIFENVQLVYTPPFNEYINKLEDLDSGCIVGKVTVVDCQPVENLIRTISNTEKTFGYWWQGHYAWKLENPVRFKKPIPANGKLKIWEFDDKFLTEEVTNG